MQSAPSTTTTGEGSLLEGRVALVTGGGRGIGFAIAQALAKQGAKIVLNDFGCDRAGKSPDPSVALKAAEELRELGADVLSDTSDVSEPEAVAQLTARIAAEFSPVDILINNAGIISDRSLFDLEIEDWDRVIKTHLRGTFLCTQAVASGLRKAKLSGSIVNMTSTSGMLGNLLQSNESSAKAGIYGLTRTSSIELQKYRIRVNAIAAIAKTRLTEDLPMFEKVDDSLLPKHIAPAAVFLASDLSEDLSGTVLSVAGGRISTFELAESQGRIKEADGGVWTPQEIAENYDSLAKRSLDR